MKKDEKSSNNLLLSTLESKDVNKIRALFAFNAQDTNKQIVFKFNLWSRYFYPHFFKFRDADFHTNIDHNLVTLYRSQKKYFVDIAFRGAAKRQPLDAKVLTPHGWSTISQLKVGDYVIGANGKPTKVVDLSPIVDRPIYKLSTEDGRSAECDSEHLWTVRKMSNVKNKYVTIDTQAILNSGLFYARHDKRFKYKTYYEYKFAIDTVKQIEFPTKKFTLDPYLVGILLGDGSMSKEWGGARLYFHKDDDAHYRSQLLNYEITETRYDKRNKNVGRFGISSIGQEIIKLGMNVNCYNKFIPEEYLFGNIEQRKALLEGLMDTDGTVGSKRSNGGNTPAFCSVSEKLADGVVALVRSLGGRANKHKNKGDTKFNGKDYWRVSMMFTDYKPFRLKRKLDVCRESSHSFSRIVDITHVGNKLGRCIRVENEDGLYITNDYLLTHNTTRTKLFVAFAIANDTEHSKRYFKVLSADIKNSTQIVTDIYNMLIRKHVNYYYPEIFQKTIEKREETMSSFTTASGVKMQADTVGTDQRGDIQEDIRPDFEWFDDFETRKSLRSAVTTQAIWENMEEARNGLSKDGVALYNCNYVSERGNVHKLVQKEATDKMVMITPIRHDNGTIAWPAAYTKEDIDNIEKNAEDFEGEYLCKPSASRDVFFDRTTLDLQIPRNPIKTVADFKTFYGYVPGHRYGLGADVAGGVGLDHSTLVIIDFSTTPSRVVATYANNTIAPDIFGAEIVIDAQRFGEPIVAIENNKYDMCILAVKQKYKNLYFTEENQLKTGAPTRRKTYGWNTNQDSKPKMLFELKQAVEDGHLQLTDINLINELRSYTRDDLMDRDTDPRLTTRHFDLLMACAIAYQMKNYAQAVSEQTQAYEQPEYENPLQQS